MSRLTGRCPYCFGKLRLERLRCQNCHIAIEGSFPISKLFLLSPEQQTFVEFFVQSGGSLKEMSDKLRVSYPTIRNRLDKIIEVLQSKDKPQDQQKKEILNAVEKGEISAEEAAELIRGI